MNSNATPPLPAEFAGLAPHLRWALPTETERNTMRLACTQPELEDFAQALLPQVDAITRHLDEWPDGPLPEPSRNLYFMLLSLAEVAPAIEFYAQPTVVDGFASERFKADEAHVLRPRV